jgi:hypothetical protein
VSSSAGTLAHELSHDLDWQAARRLYAGGTGYSTDRAMRESNGGVLSNSVRGLASARVLGAVAPAPIVRSGANRPTELFARGGDWFVASALAREGRSNGALSLVQDGRFAGYVAGAPTALSGRGARSLVSAIGAMTYLPAASQGAFLAQWSNVRTLDPELLVRQVLETPVSARLVNEPLANIVLSATTPVGCAVDDSREVMANMSLLMMAVEARSRGVAARQRARLRSPVVESTAEDRVRYGVKVSLLTDLASVPPGQGALPLAPAAFWPAAVCLAMEQ